MKAEGFPVVAACDAAEVSSTSYYEWRATEDLGSRRLAGWTMADHMRTDLVEEALRRALDLRGGLAGAVFNSDRRSQVWSIPVWRLPGALRPPRRLPVGRPGGHVL